MPMADVNIYNAYEHAVRPCIQLISVHATVHVDA